MDEGSPARVAAPKSPLLLSPSLALGPNSPPLLEKPGCEDLRLGLRLKGFDFGEAVLVDVPPVSGDARRAFAFGLKMSPKELDVDPPVNIGLVESGAEEIGVDPGTCGVGSELVVFEVDTGAAENEKAG